MPSENTEIISGRRGQLDSFPLNVANGNNIIITGLVHYYFLPFLSTEVGIGAALVDWVVDQICNEIAYHCQD